MAINYDVTDSLGSTKKKKTIYELDEYTDPRLDAGYNDEWTYGSE